ncbi:glycoside hydrolase family 28 protein [Kibdelosporangium aridum]|uniref:Glycosyl hydrolases family 28 n=1 Tax=Kibdelosporangium aridum TaxID=2030 RepID=A0A1W2E9I5_KIBAR|nr:glycoside hydrolase family 28 protein [Kibdelosporangium aridum]SMD06325.1 Glycosyl hydrolases family 28 [Kibdelosporangium aridum]
MANERSRRAFLKATGLVTAGLAVPVTAHAAEASPWDQVPLILARIVPPTFPDTTFDVTAYGAKGDGKTKNTEAFRKAIEACSKAGGGRVVVPSGSFLTGAVTLLSNVNLVVSAGATVKFSTDPKDYPRVFTRWQGIECMNFSPFIYARGQRNVAITGAGTIDGQGPSGPWFDYDGKRGPDWDRLQQMAVDNVPVTSRTFGSGHFLKPNMIQLYECQNVLVEGVNLRNPAMWTIHPVLARNVTVRDVKVYSRGGMVDGCDPEASSDVHITGCQFDTGDDGVAVKSGRDADGRRVGVPSENIVIQNCTHLGRWGALTVGSEMSGGVRNVFFEDCTIRKGSSYSAFHVLYIKTNKRRGGTVDGVHARRIKASGVQREAISVTLNYSLTGPGFGPIVNPAVRNITVADMTVDGASYAWSLDGLSESKITGMSIANSTFTKITNATPKIKNATKPTCTNVKINGKTVT